jgi:hypothetical protein
MLPSKGAITDDPDDLSRSGVIANVSGEKHNTAIKIEQTRKDVIMQFFANHSEIHVICLSSIQHVMLPRFDEPSCTSNL